MVIAWLIFAEVFLQQSPALSLRALARWPFGQYLFLILRPLGKSRGAVPYGGSDEFLYKSWFLIGCSLDSLQLRLPVWSWGWSFLDVSGRGFVFWSIWAKTLIHCLRSMQKLWAEQPPKPRPLLTNWDALHRALMTSEQFSFGRCGYSGGGANVSPFDVDLEDASFPFGCFEGEMASKEFVVAKEIEADRVSFVGRPAFDPRPYFDDVTTFAYEHPLQRSKDFEPVAEPPRVHVHASPLERKLLFRAMAQTDRLIALSEEEVRSDRLAGLFCVPKSLTKDRLILDSRPANGAEPPLSRWTSTMASYACLGGIELEDEEELRLSGRDISDYFYQFKVSRERGLRNVMSCWLRAEELEFIFGRPFSAGGYVGLNTLAMGDLAACEFAQCAHLGVILQSRCSFPGELLQMHRPTPRGEMLLGVVIDDLVCLEKVLRRMAGSPDFGLNSKSRMSRVMEEYEKCGLPVNLKKSFDLVGHSSFWGVQLDVKGLYRPNDSRFWPLVLVTIRVLSLGVCTIGLMQSMAGSWISVLSVRKRLMSLMNLIFDAIAAASGPRQVVRLSGGLRDELLTYVVCGCLSVVNLRAKVLPTIRATDSSNWGNAAVQCSVPLPVAKEAMRLSLSRSLWSKLLPPSKAWLREKGILEPSEELPDAQCYDTHPFWEALGRCYNYNERWRRSHPRAIHINVGELRGYLRDELLTATEYTSVRIPYAMDSQVSLWRSGQGQGIFKSTESGSPQESWTDDQLWPLQWFWVLAVEDESCRCSHSWWWSAARWHGEALLAVGTGRRLRGGFRSMAWNGAGALLSSGRWLQAAGVQGSSWLASDGSYEPIGM